MDHALMFKRRVLVAVKLKRYTISLICAVLCWALVITPCLCIAGNSFAPSYDKGSFVALQGATIPVVPADKVSLPPVIMQEITGSNDVDNVQDLATSDKVLSGLGSGSGSPSVPSKPAVTVTPPVVQTPQTPVVTPPVSEEKDVTYATLTQPDGKGFTYYEQTWAAYSSYPYGYNTVGSHGCGPTSMAMVITNLTGITVSPKYMADWAVNNGYYVRGRGTAYGIFPAASAAYGIKCSTISCYDKAAVVSALQSGKLLITVVGYGDFTNGRHFLLLRGITADGKILVADSGKYENCLQEWDYNRVISQVANSYFWVFEK